MILAAHEDKTYRGAFIASPTMPWAWGTGFEFPKSGVYHAVWSRDLYQIVTGMMAAGDRGAAERALSFVFGKQQRPDGSDQAEHLRRRHAAWDGTPAGRGRLPARALVAAASRRRADLRPTRQAGGRLAGQDRPAVRHGSLGEPGRLVAGHDRLGDRRADLRRRDLARQNGDDASAATYEQTADTWQKSVESWTATTNGPYSDKPYDPRVTLRNANPNDGSTYSIGDSGPSAADERTVVDPSFLELVRLGVKRPDDPTILNSIAVVDQQLAVDTPNGRFWHRANFDGYGEQLDGQPWNSFPAGHPRPPAAAPARSSRASAGEYNLTAGATANAQLAAMAGAANEGGLIPEQVWDDQPPSGKPGLPEGRGHAVGDAAGVVARPVPAPGVVDRGGARPVEQPSIVACRYARTCEALQLEPAKAKYQTPKHSSASATLQTMTTSRTERGRPLLALAAHRLHPGAAHARAGRGAHQACVGAVELREALADDDHRGGDADEQQHVGPHRGLRGRDEPRDEVQPADRDAQPEQDRADRHEDDEHRGEGSSADVHPTASIPDSRVRKRGSPGLAGPAMRARDRRGHVGLEDVAARACVHRAVVGTAGLAHAALVGQVGLGRLRLGGRGGDVREREGAPGASGTRTSHGWNGRASASIPTDALTRRRFLVSCWCFVRKG